MESKGGGGAIAALQQMKRDRRKIVCIVAWDYQIAQIAERAGADMISVGDSVGVNLWGHASESELTIDEFLVACKAVRRGVKRALLSCDVPSSAVQAGTEAAVAAARRLVDEAGADIVKVLGDEAIVRAIVGAGVPVFAEFHGQTTDAAELAAQAKRLQDAGASLLDVRHSGPMAGPVVAQAVSIPVIGGLGGGPWLDGRVRMAHAAINYAASTIGKAGGYANVASTTLDALLALAVDVRAGRQIKY